MTDALSDTPRRGLLTVLAGNMLLDALAVSIVLIGLPATGLPMFQAQWLMSGFALGFACALLAGPTVTACWGRRRPYLVAMLVFAVASVAGGLTDVVPLIVASRVVTGACAAFTAPTGLAIIGCVFPTGPARLRAVSVYAMTGAAGFSVGVLCAGVLTTIGWRWDLVAPAPVALLLACFAARWLPADAGVPVARPSQRGLLANRTLVRCALGAAALNGVFLTTLLLTVFRLRDLFGGQPLLVALALLPACLPVVCGTPFTARLVHRYGTGDLIACGAVAVAAGCALRATTGSGTYGALLPALGLLGVGFAICFGALNTQVVNATEPAHRAAAVALYQVCVQAGAVLMLILVAGLTTLSGTDQPAVRLIAVVALLAAVLSVTPRRSCATVVWRRPVPAP